MKKSLLVVAIVSVMALGATFAMAQGVGADRGMGHMRHGCMPMASAGQPVDQITADAARTRVQEYVTQNYRGYTVGDATGQTGPRGATMYVVNATDASGNRFVFHVAPNGFVRGPMLESQYNEMLQYRQQRMQNAPARPQSAN